MSKSDPYENPLDVYVRASELYDWFVNALPEISEAVDEGTMDVKYLSMAKNSIMDLNKIMAECTRRLESDGDRKTNEK